MPAALTRADPTPPLRLPALRRVITRLGRRLYVRLWLAVILAVAALILLVSWVWQLAAEPPLREVVVRNDQGQVIGHGLSHRHGHPLPPHLHFAPGGPAARPPASPLRPLAAPAELVTDAHTGVPVLLSGVPAPGASGPGPEFLVRMDDGQVLHVHLPRPARTPWSRPPFDFFWMLVLVGVAVALATYPILRKLTRRLEQLHIGVEEWGRGDLSVRVAVQGQDEVAFLARRFNLAASRIQELLSAHKSLLANASHELRSPLTRIRMSLELMGEHPTLGTRQEIERSIAELDQLIDEILLASRLDSREIDLGRSESVDLLGLAAEECARVGASLQSAPGQTELRVQGVPKLLRRALRNLLENARRFSPEAVTLALEAQGQQQVLRVSDRGPGVPADLRERIFEPFYRLPGASEREGNVGLGLALVKSIAERHGGQVHCEDHPGGGACFVLALPAETTAPAAAHPPDPQR